MSQSHKRLTLLLTRYLWYFVRKKTLIALLVTNTCRPTTHILRTLLEDEQKRSLVPNKYQAPVKRSVIWNKEGDKTTKPIFKKLDRNTCNRSSTHYDNQYHDHKKCQECSGSKAKASYIFRLQPPKKKKENKLLKWANYTIIILHQMKRVLVCLLLHQKNNVKIIVSI